MTVFDSGDFRVRPMGRKDLDQVLRWRNHPEIRRYMYTQHEITLEEHTRWFEEALQDESRELLIFEHNEEAIGFVQFNILDADGVADWGFYVAPSSPKGMGYKLGRAALVYAFEQIGVHKICGQALDYNERSINFHRRLGFQQEGVLRDHHFDGISYHAVLCFGLLRKEWSPSHSG